MHIAPLAFLLLLAPLTAQDIRTVRGIVVDEGNRPLEGVAVCPFHEWSEFVVPEVAAEPAARTAADGTFTLRWDPQQRPSKGNVLFIAEGRVHVAAGLGYVDMIPIVLPRGRTLAGTVRDRAGKPVAGVRVEARDWLTQSGFFGIGGSAWSVAPEPRTAVRTDASGRFVLSGTCETAIHLQVRGLGFTCATAGPLAAGASWDVVVDRAPVVTVQVVDADGAPLPGVSLSATAALPTDDPSFGSSDAAGRWRFTWTGTAPVVVAARADDSTTIGRLELAGPTADVLLPTHAAAVDVPVANAPDPDAIAVRGRVLDGDAPVAGAFVFDISPSQARNAERYELLNFRGEGAVRTGADGAFVLHLRPGSRALAASVDELGGKWRMPGHYRNPTPVPIEVQAGKEPQPIDLHLQRLVDVRGRVEGAGNLPRGCMLWFKPENALQFTGDEFDFDDRCALQPDGSFVARGLQTRRYHAHVLVPRGFRQGLPDKMFLATVKVDPDTELRLQGDRARPAVAHGIVRGEVPYSRLALMSLAASDEKAASYSCVHYWGPVVPVQRDGAYRLTEPPGRRALLVVDMATGVVLSRGPTGEIAPGDDRALDFELTARPVDLRARGLPDGGKPWVHIVVAEENWPSGLGQMVALGGDRRECGLGIGLVPGAEEPTRIWLAGPARLVLRKSRGVRSDGKDVLADVTVDPSKERSVLLDAAERR